MHLVISMSVGTALLAVQAQGSSSDRILIYARWVLSSRIYYDYCRVMTRRRHRYLQSDRALLLVLRYRVVRRDVLIGF